VRPGEEAHHPEHPFSRWRLGEPVLSIELDRATVGLRPEVGPEARLWLVDESREGGGAILVTTDIAETELVGSRRAVGGQLPLGAAAVQLIDERGNDLPVRSGHGVWLGVGPAGSTLEVTFVDLTGEIVAQQALPGRSLSPTAAPRRGLRLPVLRRLPRRRATYGP
jgi:hypothetical protein